MNVEEWCEARHNGEMRGREELCVRALGGGRREREGRGRKYKEVMEMER